MRALLLLVAAGSAWAMRTQDLQLRLESPRASYSRPGTAFPARIGVRRAYSVARRLVIRGVVRRSLGRFICGGTSRAHARIRGLPVARWRRRGLRVRLLAVDNAQRRYIRAIGFAAARATIRRAC